MQYQASYCRFILKLFVNFSQFPTFQLAQPNNFIHQCSPTLIGLKFTENILYLKFEQKLKANLTNIQPYSNQDISFCQNLIKANIVSLVKNIAHENHKQSEKKILDKFCQHQKTKKSQNKLSFFKRVQHGSRKFTKCLVCIGYEGYYLPEISCQAMTFEYLLEVVRGKVFRIEKKDFLKCTPLQNTTKADLYIIILINIFDIL